MKTKDFSEEIIMATNSAKGKNIKKKHAQIISAISFGVSYLATRDFQGNPLYHLSGPIAYIAGKLADYYSTYQTAKLFEDPRFSDYGLDNGWYESNSSLPLHPSQKDLSDKRVLPAEIVLGIGTAIVPFAGYGLGVGGLIAYENNKAVVNQIKKGLEIGDHVERMISEGSADEDIRKYLSSLTKKS